MSALANILIIDDEESMREGCKQILTGAGCRVKTAENGIAGLEKNARESFDVILLDLKMPGISGMDLLKKIKAVGGPHPIIIVITAYGSIDIAVAAMRHGAFNFLTKPFEPDGLVLAVKEAIKSRRRDLEKVSMDSSLNLATEPNTIIGRSSQIREVVELVQKVAPSDSTVLIQGETGVGKELLAKTIHRLSARHDKPFVSVDCGALVESLFESEMFGHVKGSFTGAIQTTKGKFELANGGTLFLDEITNIGINIQTRLLRSIQEREISKVGSSDKIKIDVRITVATNKDLPEEINAGRFREDLYYRLNVVPIRIPPLRDRREDIMLLASYFLRKLSEQKRCAVPKLSDEAGQFLDRYEWPGNIRELKNTIERAFVISDGKIIGIDDLTYDDATLREAVVSENGMLAELEKTEIAKVLKQFNGHRSRTADYLGINRKTLREKIRKYGIEI